MQAAHQSSNELSRFLECLRVGVALDLGDVFVVPLFAPSAALRVALLEEALARREARVTEVTEHGRVDTLRVDNLGEVPLLLLDGEQIVGAKQDRVFNATMLVPPRSSIAAPVSCVERGRWHADSREMTSAEATLTPSIRASKLKSVATTLRTTQTYGGDQGRVWRDVENYAERTGTRSETMSFVQCLRARGPDVAARARALEAAPGQVGIAVVRGNVVASLDAFGSEELYARNQRKIARGVLAEIGERAQATVEPQTTVQRAIAALAHGHMLRCAALGCGETLTVEAAQYALAAITYGGEVFHLLATGA